MFRGFRTVLMVCGLGNLSESTNLAKFGRDKIFIHLWDLQRERDFRIVMGMGTKEIIKFWGSIHLFVQIFS